MPCNEIAGKHTVNRNFISSAEEWPHRRDSSPLIKRGPAHSLDDGDGTCCSAQWYHPFPQTAEGTDPRLELICQGTPGRGIRLFPSHSCTALISSHKSGSIRPEPWLSEASRDVMPSADSHANPVFVGGSDEEATAAGQTVPDGQSVVRGVDTSVQQAHSVAHFQPDNEALANSVAVLPSSIHAAARWNSV
jgi:hypothetical protein